MHRARIVLAIAMLVGSMGCSKTHRGKPRTVAAQPCPVPSSAAELLPWLQKGGYRELVAEPAVHKSKGPHPVLVRSFFTPELAASLAANNEDAEHPACSAAVKELFHEDGTSRRGWAVAVKIRPESNDGDNWYWYEVTEPDGSDLVADGDGVPLCKNCHFGGHDFVLSTPTPDAEPADEPADEPASE
jgi:hypothetical protein